MAEVIQHPLDYAQDVLWVCGDQCYPLCCCVMRQQAECSGRQKPEQTDLQSQWCCGSGAGLSDSDSQRGGCCPTYMSSWTMAPIHSMIWWSATGVHSALEWSHQDAPPRATGNYSCLWPSNGSTPIIIFLHILYFDWEQLLHNQFPLWDQWSISDSDSKKHHIFMVTKALCHNASWGSWK